MCTRRGKQSKTRLNRRACIPSIFSFLFRTVSMDDPRSGLAQCVSHCRPSMAMKAAVVEAHRLEYKIAWTRTTVLSGPF